MLFNVEGDRNYFRRREIIDAAAWGRPELLNASAALVSRIIDAHPGEDLYWYLISKGHRTYRFLPVLFREFFPRRNAVIPPLIKDILDNLGESRFPGLYESETGIVRADEQAYWLRENMVPIGEGPESHLPLHLALFHLLWP